MLENRTPFSGGAFLCRPLEGLRPPPAILRLEEIKL